jgi:dGTPase
VVDVADSLAYDTHDTDDALAMGLLTLADLDGVEFWQRAAELVRRKHPQLGDRTFRPTVIREWINWQVGDLIAETQRRIRERRIDSIAAVRACDAPLVGFSTELQELKTNLERFLRECVYQHHRVLRRATKGKRFLRRMFEAFVRTPNLLPEHHLLRWRAVPDHFTRRAGIPMPPEPAREDSLGRVIGDYLAGMTDRFAQQEYLHLFHPDDDL